MPPPPDPNGLPARGRALDQAFFRRDSKAFVERLRARLKEEAAKEDLAAATGIDDAALLGRLAGLGIRADTLAALTLVPLIRVAWADGVMEERERRAVLHGAVSTGLHAGTPSYALLEIWTEDPPPPDLARLWREFIQALCRELSPDERLTLRDKLLSRARDVAQAAGDLLRDGSMVSPEEEAVLLELGEAFSPAGS